MKEFHFANPDEVGSSEYRAIHDCLQDGLETCESDARQALAEAMHQILRRLVAKRLNGKYVACAGTDLIEALNLNCGQNGIASQFLEFRNKAMQRLLEGANITCERNSIIASGGPGYRLLEWIAFESGTRSAA